MLARNLGRLENCSGFHNTGVTEDEGQFLQHVYVTDLRRGGPGRFGFDPRSHLTEESDLLTPDNIIKLRENWLCYWDNSKAIFVEKTPGNLLMTRFLQAVFPNSYFVTIRRHPIAVSMATQTMWKINRSSLHSLFDHWLYCHDLFDEDKKYLRHSYELTYEDYIQDPAKYHAELAAFIGTGIAKQPLEDKFRTVVQVRSLGKRYVRADTLEEVSGTHNEKYFARWSRLIGKSPWRSYYRYIAGAYESRFGNYGYSLTTGLDGYQRALIERRKFSTRIGALECRFAESHALMWRLLARTKLYLKKRITHFAPVGGNEELSQV